MRTQRYPQEIIDQAIALRKQELTYEQIIARFPKLSLSKSVLSYWMSKNNIKTSKTFQIKQKQKSIKIAQNAAAAWHKKQKLNSFANAKHKASQFLGKTPIKSRELLFFLSGLYLGEGIKGDESCTLANSNAEIVKAFKNLLRHLFDVPSSKMKARLHLRHDQSQEKFQSWWAQQLHFSSKVFTKTQVEKRGKNIATRSGYKGVCALSYHNVTIQRFLLELQEQIIGNINCIK